MINQITKDLQAKKQAGVKKVRVILIKDIEKNGRKVPQVVNIMECEPAHAILKSGKLASPLRAPIEMCKGEYDRYEMQDVKSRYDDEDGAFERS